MPLINFSGLASGIDSSALISALLDQQRASRVTPLETRIADLQDTNSAFSELSTLLSTLSDKASAFRTVNGGAISRLASSTDETVATATASNSAVEGSYTLTVTQLASNGTLSFQSTAGAYTSADDTISSSINNGAAAADRTVSVTTGSETVDIELTDSTTLNDFVSQFNSASTNATASVVNIGDSASPDYRVMIVSDSQGTQDGSLSVNVGTEITTNSAFDDNTIDQAQDAQFTLSGIADTITRSSNTVTDLIAGVSFSLESTGTATIAVTNDTDATTTSMREFVEAYNEVVQYISENDQITREENGNDVENIFGALAETSLDEGILTSLRGALSGAGISGGSVNILADLGITTERDGTLAFDEDTFADAMATDSESVGTITANLGETLAAVNGTIAQYTQFNGLIDQAVNSNNTSISSMQDQIADTESSLARQEQVLVSQFARLEALIGEMNSQMSTLASILPA